jgi:hypothetical protein
MAGCSSDRAGVMDDRHCAERYFYIQHPVLQALVYVQDGIVSEDYTAFITGKKSDGTSFGNSQ